MLSFRCLFLVISLLSWRSGCSLRGPPRLLETSLFGEERSEIMPPRQIADQGLAAESSPVASPAASPVAPPNDAPGPDALEAPPTDPPIVAEPAVTQAPVSMTSPPTAAPKTTQVPAAQETTAPDLSEIVTSIPTAVPPGSPGDDLTLAPSSAGKLITEAPVSSTKDTPAPSSGEPSSRDSNTTQTTPTDAPSEGLPNQITETPTGTPSVAPTMRVQTPAPTPHNVETDWPTEYIPAGEPGIDSPTGDSGGFFQPVKEPTDPPVEYVPPDDDILADEPDVASWDTPNESMQQMEHDRNVLIALGTVFGVMLLFSIIVSHQILHNPDGCCASICRLVTRCTCCIVGTICFPCRMICGGGGSRQGHMRMSNDHSTFASDLELN